jgi:hypothetical protein
MRPREECGRNILFHAVGDDESAERHEGAMVVACHVPGR